MAGPQRLPRLRDAAHEKYDDLLYAATTGDA
jgi:hypothetical protein